MVITVPFEITNFGDTDRGHALSQIQLGRVLDTAYTTTAHYKFLVDHAIDMKIIKKHDSVSSIEYDVEFKISKKHDTYYRLRYE